MKVIKDKKGFTIVETIVVAVMLTTSLLMIYSSYSSSIINERIRLYYDDAAYIYKANNIKEYLIRTASLELYVEYSMKPQSDDDYDSMLVNISGSSKNLFTDDEFKNGLTAIQEHYNLSEFILLKPDFNIISKCNSNSVLSLSGSDKEHCNQFLNISSGTRNYIKTLGTDIKISDALIEPYAYFLEDYKAPINDKTNYGEYILIYVFRESNDGTVCEVLESCKVKYTYLRSGVYYEK